MKIRARQLAVLVTLVLGLGIALEAVLPQVLSGTWSSTTSPMSTARSGASAALLQDWRILITGGDSGSGPVATAEFFATDGSFSSAPAMNNARSGHVSATLSDGRVLVAGGTTTGGGATNAAEIFDPTSSSWTEIAGGMTEARSGATATLLQDGRVLIAGGSNGGAVSQSAEIFDPNANAFSFAGKLSSPRMQHAAALLQDGRVLIVGGTDGTNIVGSSDLYDPLAGTVSQGPALTTPRQGLSATTLLDGRVIAIGGANNGQNGLTELASAEIYDPVAGGGFAAAPSSLATARQGHLAFLLPHNNSVLIVGGLGAGAPLSSAELYIPWQNSGTFVATGAMATARSSAAGSAMSNASPQSQDDGLLLVGGGSDGTNSLAGAELYGFNTVKTDQTDYAPGTTVNITGTGWQPNETVTLSFQEVPTLDTPPTLTAVADANGNIANSQFVPDLYDVGVTFYLTAVGQTSGYQAQTTFTDLLKTDTAISSTNTSPNIGDLVTFTATVTKDSDGSAVTSGTVDFGIGTSCSHITTSIATGVSLSGSGQAQASHTFTSAGSPKVFACYSGSGSASTGLGASSDSVTETVSSTVSTTLVLSAPSPATVPQGSAGPVSLSATLTRNDTSGGVTGATITFTVDASSVGTAVTIAGGVATLSYNPSTLSAGSHTVQASFAGATISSTTFAGSTSGSQTLTVVAPPTISKAFGAATIPLNGTTSLTLTITNPNTGTDLSGIAFTDTLPGGLVVASPNGQGGTCSTGTITATAASSSVSWASGTLAKNSSCTIIVNVKGTSAGEQDNTTGAISSTEGGTGTTSNTASVTVEGPPTISKAFGAATIPLNGTTSLTLTITNPNTGTDLSGIGFTDTLPGGLVVATPNGQGGTCSTGTITATAGSGSVSWASGTLAKNSSCTIIVNVKGTSAGEQDNTTGKISSTEGGTGTTSNTASITVVGPPTISKAFGVATIPLNGTTSLTLTITNPNTGTDLSGIAFTDTLPGGLVVASPNGLTGTCSTGTITATAASGSVSWASGTLAKNSSCTIVVNVKGTTAGEQDNTTGAISSTEGGTGTTSNTATVTVVAPPTISKAFGAATIPLNGTTSLTLTITNPNTGTDLSGIAFTDTLPGGLVVASPNGLTGTCSTGTITATAASGSVSWASGTLAKNSSCTIIVNVKGTTAGVKDNTTGAISSTEGGTGTTSNKATVTVVAPPTVRKAFAAAIAGLPLGSSTRLTFVVTNPNTTVSLSGIGFTDTLPTGLVVATPNGVSGTCGAGTITATAGTGSVSLSGGTLAASSSCTFSVNVLGVSMGTATNVTGAITSTEGGTGTTSNTATVVVTAVSTTTTAAITYNGVPNNSSVQYSDYVTLSATVAPKTSCDVTICGTLTGTIDFYVNGVKVLSGVSLTDAAAGKQYHVLLQAGTYPVYAVFNSTNSNFLGSTSSTVNLVVVQEDAFIKYTGGTVGQVNFALTLQATVWDSAAVGYPGIHPESGPSATIGDITKMWIEFDVYPVIGCGSGSPVASPRAQVLNTPGSGIGTATTTYTSSTENSYCVIAKLVAGSGGGVNQWYVAPNAEPAGIAFFTNAGEFATGGGWIIDPTGSHGNFGFNARYGKKGTPTGQMVYVWRALYPDPYNANQMVPADFIIKSTSQNLTALSFTQTGGTFPNSALVQGSCVLQIIRESDGVQIGGQGNLTFTMQATDSGKSSGIGSDSFAVTVLDSSNNVVKGVSSTLLSGGNIVIHVQ